jgi:AraC-like DNA-binding protein
MIVTTRFPDLPPRPETPANAAFRREYFARWGRENVVFMAATRRFESMPQVAPMSVKLVERGTAEFRVGRRRVVLEPGSCLVVNEGESYSLSIASDTPVQAFSLHFRPGLAGEVAAARSADWPRALDCGSEGFAGGTPQLRSELHAPSPALVEVMADVRQQVLEGERTGDALEPLFIAALDRLLADDQAHKQRAGVALDAVRPATRAELLRRVGWAHDFILSNYAEAVSLESIAAAAHLSKYHLLRTFRQVYGETPHALLRARRAAVAETLLGEGERDLAAVADAVGFGSRWAMQRALREHCGSTGRALRRARA